MPQRHALEPRPLLNQACMLQQWSRASHVAGLPGLELGARGFSLDKSFFPCCQGTGLQAVTSKSMARCELLRRVRLVHRLLGLYGQQWREQAHVDRLLKLVDTPDVLTCRSHLSNLAQLQDSIRVKGRQVESLHGPSSWWAAALKLAWIDGVAVAIYRFDEHATQMPDLGLDAAADGTLPLLVLEGVDHLWEPAYAERFERWLRLADDRQQPVWIDLVRHRSESRARGSVFQKRLADQRNEQMFLELSPRVRAILVHAGIAPAAKPAQPGVQKPTGYSEFMP